MNKNSTRIRKIIAHLLFLTAAAEFTVYFFFAFQPYVIFDKLIKQNKELYFENQAFLPAIAKPNKNYNFAFTIHNPGSEEVTFKYEVYMKFREGGITAPIDSGIAHLEPDNSKTIKEVYSFVNKISNSEVIVKLINRDKEIAFNVN